MKTTYEPLRTYSENCDVYAMLPKGFGVDRGFQRSLPASQCHSSECCSLFYHWTAHKAKLGSFVGDRDFIVSLVSQFGGTQYFMKIL